MKYVQLPVADEVRHLSFYLAMEEYVARYIDEPDCFYVAGKPQCHLRT